MTLSIRILLFLLLVVEGVESHPGPHRGDRGGHGCKNAAQVVGAPRGRGWRSRSNDYFANSLPLGGPGRHDTDPASLRRSQKLQNQSSLNRQLSISSWLTSSQAQAQRDSMHSASHNSNVPRYLDTNTDSETEPDNVSNAGGECDVNDINMTNILLEIRTDVKSMNNTFGKMKKKQ